MSEQFISKGLKKWLGCNIVTDFCDQFSPNVIVLDGGDATQTIWHIIAWSTEKGVPQLHERVVLLRFHPYLRHSASQNLPLCRMNPCSVTGRTMSHANNPFSSIELVLLSVAAVDSAVQVYVVLVVLVAPFSFTLWCFLSGYCSSSHPNWDLVQTATKGGVMHLDALNAWADSDVGLASPRPPSLTGRAKRSLSTAEQGSLLVSAGMNCLWMAISRGCSRSWMWGIFVDPTVQSMIVTVICFGFKGSIIIPGGMSLSLRNFQILGLSIYDTMQVYWARVCQW